MTTVTETPTTPLEGDEYVVATEPSGLVRVEHASHGVLTIDPRQTEFNEVQRVALRAMNIETEGEDAVPIPNVLMFLHQCQVMLLDPYLKQAYLIVHGKINRTQSGTYDNRKFTFVIGIDGFRRRGALAGGADYSGVTEPEWAGEDERWRTMWSKKWAAEDAEWGQPLAARVGVRKRHDPDRPTYGVAMYDEFVPLVDEYVKVTDPQTGRQVWENGRPKSRATGRKVPTEMWTKMPANQIAKCAEAAAWRKAYPDTFSGVYSEEEMERAKVEYEAQKQERDEADAQQRARRATALPAARPKATAPDVPVEGRVVERAAEAPAAPTRSHRVVQHDGPARTAPAPEPAARPPLGADSEKYLRAEIASVAAWHGRPVGMLVERYEGVYDKKYADWSVDLLLRFVEQVARPRTIQAMREKGVGEPDAYAVVPEGDVVTNPAEFGLPVV